MQSHEHPGQRSISFSPSRDHSSRVSAKRRLNLNPELLHLLVFLENCEPEFLSDLLSMVYVCDDRDSQIGVVCTGNMSRLRQVQRDLGHIETIRFYGNAVEIPLLLDSADLLLSEPSEIIAAEAVKRRLPLVLLHDGSTELPASCRDLIDRGCAAFGRDEVELADLCIRLLDHEARRSQMSKALKDDLI